MSVEVLQLAPLPPPVQATLDSRYTVHRWPEAPGEQETLLREHAANLRAVVTGGHLGIDPALAARLPNLGIVAISGVGYDRIDLEAMRSRGVRVTNTPDVLTDDVADLAIALMLNVMRALPAAEQHVRAGLWPSEQPPLARRASGLRYGIVGIGRIGRAIASRLEGFGGSIAYTSPTSKAEQYRFFPDARALAEASDVLFVATAASAATKGMINRPVLDGLGPQGVLVNIARGSIIDEPELVSALAERRIWGAGLDVFADEPNVPEALWTLPNVALAPHVGSATVETREAMGNLMLDNLAAFLAGQPLLTAVV
jgi:hydroxypyruvate reductase